MDRPSAAAPLHRPHKPHGHTTYTGPVGQDTYVYQGETKATATNSGAQEWSIDHIDYRYHFRYVRILGGLQRTLILATLAPFNLS
jgi:hypothetical protein